MSAWIKMIPPDAASGLLAQMYEKVKTPHGTVDNVMQAHSLRPRTMEGHVALYRSVLHSPDNVLPLWFLEVIAAYVSLLNRCAYSLTHHWANAERLMADGTRSAAVRAALDGGRLEEAFAGRELALLRYAGKLATQVAEMQESDVTALRTAGCDDGEILEANQVCAYFSYSNRLLNGLGVTTAGDVIGYYRGGERR